MRISALQSLVSVNCDNEIVNHLRHIRHFWLSLVDGNLIASKKINHDTRFDSLIYFLYIFFKDFKYLVICAYCIKRLLGYFKGSIYTIINHIFIALSEGDPMEQFELGYRQVWLYAIRYYLLMPPDLKTDAKLFANSNRVKADEHTVYKMARLAYRLGFRSTEIEELVNQSPDRVIARTVLLQARKSGIFRYNPYMFELLVDRIIKYFQNIIPDQARISPEHLTNSSIDLCMRCGLSRIQTHNDDRRTGSRTGEQIIQGYRLQ
ncbi:hypothetical protein BO71DRAFT_417467 [Aspergillus ellipticus CBS 707.79]|uniref:Uncharacterized protein n=1 Tax=Aspergillus ellipticus CBS 707.79 TaxID=1448320 RepID=A0A319DHG2_9EURO|nr:hypothetical protein BO71DRAFT_417467 [Aspergillus ellipticus CBS 707.79]